MGVLTLEAKPAERTDYASSARDNPSTRPIIIGRYCLPTCTMIETQKPQRLTRYPGEPTHQFVARFLRADLKLL